MEMNDTYRTKDLFESAALYSSKQKLIKVDKSSKPYWFVFSGRESCEKISLAFWNKSLKVSAKEFSDSIQSLKTIIFN